MTEKWALQPEVSFGYVVPEQQLRCTGGIPAANEHVLFPTFESN